MTPDFDALTQLRSELLIKAQSRHLAASLCPLESIVIEPTLLAPPTLFNYEHFFGQDSLTLQTIPYHPDWSEIASYYPYPRIRLNDLPFSNLRLIITGEPGSGKTTALFYLASDILKKSETDNENVLLPIYIHIADLIAFSNSSHSWFENLVDLVAAQNKKVSSFEVSTIMKNFLNNQRLLFLIDGFDQCEGEGLAKAVSWLEDGINEIGENPIIVVADSYHLDGLLKLNFWPCLISPWTHEMQTLYIKKWMDIWQKSKSLNPKDNKFINVSLLSGWIDCDERYLTPLEITLKAFGALSNGLHGREISSFYESYFLSISSGKIVSSDLALLSEKILEDPYMHLPLNLFEKYLANKKPIDDGNTGNSSFEKKKIAQVSKSQMLIRLHDAGCLIEDESGNSRFLVPALASYCASKVINLHVEPDKLTTYSGIKSLAFAFSSTKMDEITWLDHYLSVDTAPLFISTQRIGRWLRFSPPESAWHGIVLKRLVNLLKTDYLPTSLRIGFLMAICLSNDTAASMLFQSGLTSNDFGIRFLSVIGCGLLKDKKATNDLLNILSDPSDALRIAACLSLASYKTKLSLQLLEEILIDGEEKVQTAAAEYFAWQGKKGFEILCQATESKNLMARRAAVKGLTRIREDLSSDLLRKISINESQWIVKNAALQALESHEQPDPFVPLPLKPPAETQWILDCAMRFEQPKPHQSFPYALIIELLRNGSSDEMISTMGYLINMPDDIVPTELINHLKGEVNNTQDGAFYCMYLLNSSGKTIPQFTLENFIN